MEKLMIKVKEKVNKEVKDTLGMKEPTFVITEHTREFITNVYRYLQTRGLQYISCIVGLMCGCTPKGQT
jgi:uncharacterized protein (UPF0297 family)